MDPLSWKNFDVSFCQTTSPPPTSRSEDGGNKGYNRGYTVDNLELLLPLVRRPLPTHRSGLHLAPMSVLPTPPQTQLIVLGVDTRDYQNLEIKFGI